MPPREDPVIAALRRSESTPDPQGNLRVVVYIDRADLRRLYVSRQRGRIGRDAFDRLVMRLGRSVLEAIVEEEATGQ